MLQIIACTENQNFARKNKPKVDAAPAVDSDDGNGFCSSCSVPQSVEGEYKFLKYFMSVPESVRKQIGHQFEPFIKECTFRGRDCLDER